MVDYSLCMHEVLGSTFRTGEDRYIDKYIYIKNENSWRKTTPVLSILQSQMIVRELEYYTPLRSNFICILSSLGNWIQIKIGDSFLLHTHSILNHVSWYGICTLQHHSGTEKVLSFGASCIWDQGHSNICILGYKIINSFKYNISCLDHHTASYESPAPSSSCYGTATPSGHNMTMAIRMKRFQ